MLNRIKEFWKKYKSEIMPTVIGGVILAIILSLSQHLRELVIKGLDKIQVEVTIPFYWLLTMFALGVLLTRLLIWRANKKTKKRSYYAMDEIHGLIWEWSNWVFPRRVKPLCPRCLAELVVKDGYDKSEYFCVSCNFDTSYNLSKHALLKLVDIEIDKRERTGDWKQAEKRIKEYKKRR